MNLWLVLGAVAALVLIVVVIGTRRPRSVEDELAQPAPQPKRTDRSSLPVPDGLKGVLHRLQTCRETGTLQLSASERTASLYFLFGHLFHVTTGTLVGEAALQECLTWQDFRSTFDKTAKLPTEETIARPLDEILA